MPLSKSITLTFLATCHRSRDGFIDYAALARTHANKYRERGGEERGEIGTDIYLLTHTHTHTLTHAHTCARAHTHSHTHTHTHTRTHTHTHTHTNTHTNTHTSHVMLEKMAKNHYANYTLPNMRHCTADTS